MSDKHAARSLTRLNEGVSLLRQTMTVGHGWDEVIALHSHNAVAGRCK
ncbi:MAG: hypothetical protein WDN23_08400 [Edaphobacter sp.]